MLHSKIKVIFQDILTVILLTFSRKFQELNIGFEGIGVTGQCDEITVKVMGMRRCGCEDIVKMEKKMMPQNLYGPLEYNVGM